MKCPVFVEILFLPICDRPKISLPIISRWEGEGRKVGFHKLTKQHEQAQYRTARNLLLQASCELEHYFSKENERTTNEEIELGHDSVSCNREFE